MTDADLRSVEDDVANASIKWLIGFWLGLAVLAAGFLTAFQIG